MTPGPISLLLADDHPLVLNGMRSLIEARPDYRLVAQCADGDAALAAIRRHSPVIAVLDFNLPERDGLNVLACARNEKLATRVVIISAAMLDREVYAAINLGAYGILLKEWAADSLVDCLDTVAEGRCWFPKHFVDGALQREVARQQKAAKIAKLLTRRELQIALLVADGLSSKEIAGELHLAEGTVKLHLHSTFQKLQVNRRAELVAIIGAIRDVLPGN